MAATGGGLRVTVEWGGGPGGRGVTDQFDVSAGGLVRVRGGPAAGAIDPPRAELRLPAKAGAAWTWDAVGPDYNPPMKVAYKVVGEGEVEVPAAFKAVGVEAVLTVGPLTHRTETWYAPRVGVVKRIVGVGKDEQVMELLSFSPAAKRAAAAEPGGAPDRGGRK